jgi:hypothetical protein
VICVVAGYFDVVKVNLHEHLYFKLLRSSNYPDN